MESSELLPGGRPWIQRLVLRPQALLASSFAAAIAVGTLLLSLPFAHHGKVGLLEALFTATSAVCVTGLVVVDTGKDFTVFGQTVILLLIQAGGLGIVTFGALFFLLARRRLSLRAEAAVEDIFFQRDLAHEFRRFLTVTILTTFALEALGALVLYHGFRSTLPGSKAAFAAVFHAVSALCNAGFSTFSDSLTGWRHTKLVVWTIAGLIILGGLGFPVLLELGERTAAVVLGRKPERLHLSMHARVVLVTSAILTIAGAFLLLVVGTGKEAHNAGDAIFQSITARTAGFNTVVIGDMPLASVLILALLMFIGGSPGSTAGGIKTTTAAAVGAWLWTRIRGGIDVGFGKRRVPEGLLVRAGLLVALALLWNAAGTVILACAQPEASLRDLLFEQISAFGTVGLSCGITPLLSPTARLWIIITMFVGRLGPLTLVLWALEGERPHFRYPPGHLMIG